MIRFRPTLTLRKIFLLSLLGLMAGLALLFWLIRDVSRTTLLESARQFQGEVGREAAKGVTDYLARAPSAVGLFDKAMAQGLVDVRDDTSLRSSLFGLLLADGSLSEVSFTYGAERGFDKEGNRLLVPGTEGEISVFRSKFGGDRIVCRKIVFDKAGGRFVSSSTVAEFGKPGWMPREDHFQAVDPTSSLTFQTPATRGNEGRLLSTDLHWSQLDDALPEADRRVELSFMQAFSRPDGKFAGVLRVGLLEGEIESAVIKAVPQSDAVPNRNDPPTIFLCDSQGGLIAASFNAKKRIAEIDGDLRLVADPLPDEIHAALADPQLKNVAPDGTLINVSSQGRVYLCTFRPLPGTQDWIVGVIAARDCYLGPLIALRHRLIWASLGLIAAIVAVGFLVLRGVGRATGRIGEETAKMKAFDFSPSPAARRSLLADIREVLTGLERAKTAMRAMGKYVPVDLVRRLYRDGREPVLGGETADLSLLFSDIRDFTVFAEATTPDVLAQVLGRYLGAMATAIQGEGGTIDKYIGDSVMAFWNAPEPAADHPLRACRAALRCREALETLYASPEWGSKGLQPFETRFGVHCGTASVGHFGAPDRFNYTAIGDGVNLASRLEGLNKHYGTTILVSGAVEASEGLREAFLFRRLDRVAVKGKASEVTIFELVGERKAGEGLPPAMTRYEEALAAYQRRDFAGALSLLERNKEDAPSAFLAERCRDRQAQPPAEGWNGVQVFETK